MGVIVVNMAAFKTTAAILNLPAIPLTIFVIALIFLFVIKGSYKLTQNIMLFASLFYLAYIFPPLNQIPIGIWPLKI